MKKLYKTSVLSLLTSGILFFIFLQTVELKAQAQCAAVSVSADSIIINSGSSVKLTATATNLAGSAISFDGVDDYVFMSKRPVNNLNDWTFMAWINPALSSGYIYSEGIPDVTFGIILGANNTISVNVWNQFLSGNWLTISAANAISLNQWNHIAVTLSGAGANAAKGVLKIYVNGVEKGSGNCHREEHTGSNFSTLGQNVGYAKGTQPAPAPYKGILDEARIYNVAYTQAQIHADMNAAIPASTTGLISYWHMDEGTGTSTADATSTGNTGTLTNGPLWVTSAAAIYPAFSWSPKVTLSDSTGASVVATPTSGTTYTVTVAATGTCTASSSTVTIGITGINQIETELKEFTLSPNPSNGKVQMSFVASKKDNYQMEVMNYVGQVVYSEPISTLEGSYSRAFDFTTFEKGVYMISLRNANSQSTRRIVIQ